MVSGHGIGSVTCLKPRNCYHPYNTTPITTTITMSDMHRASRCAWPRTRPLHGLSQVILTTAVEGGQDDYLCFSGELKGLAQGLTAQTELASHGGLGRLCPVLHDSTLLPNYTPTITTCTPIREGSQKPSCMDSIIN